MKKIALTFIALAAVALPVLASAQIANLGDRPSISLNLTGLGNKIANAAWVIFTIIAVVMFVIAGIMFLTAAGNADKIAQARQAFLWGVAGIVVAIIAFTIITIVQSALQ